jgi:hypothetical protein
MSKIILKAVKVFLEAAVTFLQDYMLSHPRKEKTVCEIEFLTVASMKIAVFKDVTACSLVNKYHCFEGT